MSETTAASDGAAPRLRFEDDPGAKRSLWIAGGLLAAVLLWMGSGLVLPAEEEEAAPRAEAAPVAVAVQPTASAPVTLFFQAEGQAQPDRDTMLRAEASGDVGEILARKGQDVGEGQVLARLTTARLDADLRRAEEELSRARREFDNASQLLDRGVATTDRVAQARAALAAAQAQVSGAAESLEAADITAPFAGRVERLSLDAGEFVSAGTEVGRIVDNRPLTVAVQVPQQSLTLIRDGQPAQVSFITGETVEGAVSFVGTAASAETRTFLVEVEVPNETGAIPAGISAEIRIPTGEAAGHFISPSIVSLSPDGEIGVKTVEEGRVVFHPIEVIRAEIDGVWVTGLPDEAQVITVGQGFVRDGEAVVVRDDVRRGAGTDAGDAGAGGVGDAGDAGDGAGRTAAAEDDG